MKQFIRFVPVALFFWLFTLSPGLASDPPLALSDDFSGGLTENWIPGRAANEGGGIHALAVEDGELVWVQQYDYIESKALFGNNLKVEFDYRAGPGSMQAGEFWVELVALTDAGEYTAGIYRSQYGLQNYHAVNIGRAPSPSDSTVKENVLDDPLHLETMAPGSPRQGKITFAYADQQVRMQFENQDQDVVTTGWVGTGDFFQTKIRIWGMGGSGAPRYIDNVKIYADTTEPDDPVTDPENGSNAYTFVKIVGTDDTDFVTLDGQPTLNDAGTVAFWAEGPDSVSLAPFYYGDDGIYTGNGGPLTTVLHADEPNMQDIWGHKSINNSGAVAVQLQYLPNNTVIEVRYNGTKTTIVSRETHPFTHFNDPQINDEGLVSFWGQNQVPTEGFFQGIYTGNGVSVDTVIDYTAGADFKWFEKATSINNNGEVAFAAKADGGEYHLYKSDGTTRTYIAGPNGQFGVTHSFSLNGNGEVVFYGAGMDGVWGFSGVFSSDGDAVTEHVLAKSDGSTPFMFVIAPPAVNDAGDIAFIGLNTGVSTLNVLNSGTAPRTRKVLETGDMLDGKEVSIIQMGRHSINNNGQCVFHVMFTDASLAIYRADPAPATHILTGASPDLTVAAGRNLLIYGTSGTNMITLESGAKAELINFPGYNTIQMASVSSGFQVNRSGTVVTFQGEDGTTLKIPATLTFQTIGFTDGDLELSIQGNQVMLGDQVIGTGQSPVTGD